MAVACASSSPREAKARSRIPASNRLTPAMRTPSMSRAERAKRSASSCGCSSADRLSARFTIASRCTANEWVAGRDGGAGSFAEAAAPACSAGGGWPSASATMLARSDISQGLGRTQRTPSSSATVRACRER